MKEMTTHKTRRVLYPLALLYGWIMTFRNFLFDNGTLRSRSFKIPVISVGNITVGGTGKTPHIEYLIELLKKDYKIAVLSRGYKRKSKGFILADAQTKMTDIGDEPYQMLQKYPDITVAVDRDRCHGIEELQTRVKGLQIILLDDAYQHRYVRPIVNILLVDYHRLICNDLMLPAGDLREPEVGKNRAHIVLITKCPRDINPIDYRIILKQMNLYPYQRMYFTTFRYKGLRLLFAEKDAPLHPMDWLKKKNVLLLTGIASPVNMLNELRQYTKVKPLSFGDHHEFSAQDIQKVTNAFLKMPEASRIVVTTEKDAVRLAGLPFLSDQLKEHLYVLPIGVEFMQDQEETFNHKIIGYVRKNKRNSSIS